MVVVAEDWFEDGDIDDFSQHGINDIDDLLADGSISIEDFPDRSEINDYWKGVEKAVAARGYYKPTFVDPQTLAEAYAREAASVAAGGF
jgi:hypothetical protein